MAFISVGVGLGSLATLASAGMSLANSGSKPTVPGAPTVDLAQQQRDALAANQASLPAAEALTSQANLFNQGQITSMLNSVIPDFSGITKTSSSNIASMLRGEIPSDVQSAVMRGDAATSLNTGTAGSGMSHDLVARDLGLTSLQLTQQGLTSAESWMGAMDKMYQPGMMNVQSMFITPQQMAQQANTNANNQFQTQWMGNQIAAMPDPQMTALTKLLGGWGSSTMGGVSALGTSSPALDMGGSDALSVANQGGGTLSSGMVSPSLLGAW